MTDIALAAPSPSGLIWQTVVNTNAKSVAERTEILENPGFGTFFTDHMVDVCWSLKGGWHRPRVMPYSSISLDPAAAIFHYGQEIFEGLKAYRHADGSIWTFRPDQNAARLQRSARRLALPELSAEIFIEAIRGLVVVDSAWVPTALEASLYLRPFMIAKEAFLGVRAAQKVGFYVIASPAGAYFSGGVKSVSIWLSEKYNRAGKGGTGAAKSGGNYAASLVPQAEADENDCQQVLFLDESGQYLEELGGMNLVLVYRDSRIATPLSDSILPGITRDSILEIARNRGIIVERRRITLQEWRDGAASGEIIGAFACGTAAVVTPIERLLGDGFEIRHLDPDANTLALALRDELTGIQYGRIADTRGWMLQLV